MRYLSALFTCLLLSFPALANDANETNPHDVYGLWSTEAKTAHVDIADCGDGTPCGTIVWVKAPEGVVVRDTENPDPALRDTPLVGVKMIYGFERKSSAWKKGQIYDPSNGKSYKSAIKLKADGTLEMKGCVGPICKTQIWTAVTEPEQNN